MSIDKSRSSHGFSSTDFSSSGFSSLKLISRRANPNGTLITLGDCQIGSDDLFIAAGPCAVESREQLGVIATLLQQCGIRFLRGGAFKPRTSPYSFQGLKYDGLDILKDVAAAHGVYVITEAKDVESLDAVARYADVVQIGARNMQNYSLLEAAARIPKPILLKRGFAATIEEFLLAAEYIALNGNPNIILCERGIRTFEPFTRFTLDLSAVAILKDVSHLPIIVDPSHGVGLSEYVMPMSRAAIAAGADGLIIEVHPSPKDALSDGRQSLSPEQFQLLLLELAPIAHAVGKRMPTIVG
jgi:3-deoxy-7-phosphoheptulonate synthase